MNLVWERPPVASLVTTPRLHGSNALSMTTDSQPSARRNILRGAPATLALALFHAATLAQTAPPMAAVGDNSNNTVLPDVPVKAASGAQPPTQRTGAYSIRRSSSATGLNQLLRETPQSVSVVTRALMDDFQLHSVNDALGGATGVVVERAETDRTYYTARGFDIVNFQLDGIGTPFVYGLVDGDLDTAVYDRIEVVRGANGLMTGAGNPSATINFVRKRPTPALQASAALAYGSWDNRRVDADVSGPLNASKSLRGRLVLAAQDKDSYLDRYHHAKTVFHAIVEADLGEATVVTFGHTQQKNRPKGVLWGALPLHDTDGAPTGYARSTSTSPAWTYWHSDTDISFAELEHQFGNSWQARAVATRKEVGSRGKLFYVYGTPDPATGLGLESWPSLYDLDHTQDIVDLRASGPFTLGGRLHELVFGATASRSKLNDVSLYGQGIGTALPDLRTWDGSYPEPVFDVPGGGSSFTDSQRSLYAAVRVNPSDRLKLIVGANTTSVKSQGTSYGEARERDAAKTVPYAGVVFDLNPTYSVYGSHTGIFNPQSEIDASLNRLPPVTGESTELGVKAELLGKQLNASFAVFKARQDGLATYDTTVGNLSVYKGVDTRSEGFELEAAGSVTPRLKASAGYARLLSIKDNQGADTRTFSPRQVLRFSGTYQVLDRLKLGATLHWRSKTWRLGDDDASTVRQASYALLNLMLRYDFNDRVSATLNLNNATNKKHVASLYWTQGFYSEPRNGSVSLNWKY